MIHSIAVTHLTAGWGEAGAWGVCKKIDTGGDQTSKGRFPQPLSVATPEKDSVSIHKVLMTLSRQWGLPKHF